MTVDHSGCGWEACLRNPKHITKLVDILLPTLDANKLKFDGIAVSGYSMSLLSPIIAYWLGKSIVVVQKENENRNSCYDVEGIHGQRLIMIDDLISSGRTLRRIYKGVQSIKSELVGICLWHQDDKSDKYEFEDSEGYRRTIPLWYATNHWAQFLD